MSQPLDHLFSSKTRVKLLSLFLRNFQSEFYVRELTRKLKEQINSVRRELSNLEGIGLVTATTRDRKKYYSVNTQHVLFKELRSLFLKAQAAPKEILGVRLQKVGTVSYAALSGFFTESSSSVDLLIVGDVDRAKAKEFVQKLEEDQGREINYTIMPTSEYTYRRDLKDRFLLSVLDGKHMVLVDSEASPKSVTITEEGVEASELVVS
ncbi:MAG: winged helix-turn-helix transcriptional regulator [Candidatus Doudnabacteria bacterium]|nr:winged helix-turn-helix transcriptional regulator [Candidatus Doudnabacteria bacterium]